MAFSGGQQQRLYGLGGPDRHALRLKVDFRDRAERDNSATGLSLSIDFQKVIAQSRESAILAYCIFVERRDGDFRVLGREPFQVLGQDLSYFTHLDLPCYPRR
jgi:hypothetical protein